MENKFFFDKGLQSSAILGRPKSSHITRPRSKEKGFKFLPSKITKRHSLVNDHRNDEEKEGEPGTDNARYDASAHLEEMSTGFKDGSSMALWEQKDFSGLRKWTLVGQIVFVIKSRIGSSANLNFVHRIDAQIHDQELK